MADYWQAMDPARLILATAGLSFLISPFTVPEYNLPVLLFGMYAQEAAEAPRALQMFTGMLTGSVIFDIIWMAKHDQHGFIRFLTIILLLLKLPTILAFAATIRQSGGSFGIRGRDLADATVWSMPGGFTSSAGYQSLDVDEESHPSPPPKPPSHPPLRTTQQSPTPPPPPGATSVPTGPFQIS